MTLLIGLISLVIFTYFPNRLKDQANGSLVEKAYGLTEMAAFSLGPGLSERDPARVAEALVGMRKNPDLVYVIVFDGSGNLFTSFNEKVAEKYEFSRIPMNHADEPRLVPAGGERAAPRTMQHREVRGGFSPTGEIFQTTVPVRFHGRAVGRIFAGLSVDRVNEEIRRSRATIALVSLLIFTIGVLAVFALSRLLTGPLSRIAQTAELISAGDTTHRATVTYDDEVGQLARSFNVMVDKLGTAQQALESLNQSLESRVEIRTRELREEIDERRRAEDAFRNSEERYRLLFERNLAGVYVARVSGQLLSCNDACARIFGYDSGEELMTERGIIAYSERRDRQAIIERLKRDGTVTNEEVQLWARDGETVWALENVRLVEGRNGDAATLEGILLDINDRKKAEQDIEYKAYHDALTALPNRRLFKDRVNVALAHAKRAQLQSAVMFLDLDDLKVINDTLGHATGDILLRRVARRIVESVREEDSVARVGGDEFTVLLPAATEQEAAAVARKILDRLAQPIVIEDDEIHVTTSIGIAMYPNDGGDVETLLRNADGTMYRVKAQGGNDYQLSSRTAGKALGRQSLEQELRRAIDRDELTVYYQPQVDIKTREIKGLEALVRWKHPDHVLIEPAGFIALAEQTGLIIPIGEIVLRKACSQMILWQAAGFERIHVAVNVSARQFHQRDFIGMVERVVAETGLECDCLELEITETIAMQKSDWTIRMLNQLKEMGISIAMDDFGTGQASISYLKKFPIDKVKIDRSFVTDVALGGSDASIVTAILQLANGLNLRTVAEGVETEEQCHFLQEQGCEQIQGYLVSRPVAPDVFQKRFLMQQTANVVGSLSQMEIP